ncbi:MAG: hypothetical protein HQ541_18430 [Mariniphaga sp.]|nr:hypothetical protein [Mariniphaga sp.]
MKNNFYILYAIVVLWCVTFSHKIPGVPQEWPLLYHGVILIALGLLYSFFRLFMRRNIVFYGGVLLFLYLVLLFLMSLDIIVHPQGRNPFILRIILLHVFPIVCILIQDDKSIDSLVTTFARTISIFTLINTLIAWYFFMGGSISLFGIEYKSSIYFISRIHGVMGEPTHFGLLQGLGIISLLYLYRKEQTRGPLSRNTNILYLILGLLFFVSILFSGTRNAFISTVTTLLVYSTLDRHARKIINNYGLKIIVPILLIMSVMLYDQLYIWLSNIRYNSEYSNYERIFAVTSSIQIVSNFNIIEFLFGIGFTQSHYYVPTSFNQYIDILRNFGFLWSFIGLLLLALVIRRYMYLLKSGYFFAVYPLALLIYSLTVCMFYTPLDNLFNVVAFAFESCVLFTFLINRKMLAQSNLF